MLFGYSPASTALTTVTRGYRQFLRLAWYSDYIRSSFQSPHFPYLPYLPPPPPRSLVLHAVGQLAALDNGSVAAWAATVQGFVDRSTGWPVLTAGGWDSLDGVMDPPRSPVPWHAYGQVRQLRHNHCCNYYFGPFLTHFPRISQPCAT